MAPRGTLAAIDASHPAFVFEQTRVTRVVKTFIFARFYKGFNLPSGQIKNAVFSWENTEIRVSGKKECGKRAMVSWRG